jgi:Receptor family ligand binding region
MPYPQFEANSPVIRISETSRLIHIPIVLPISAKNQSGSLHVDLWEVSTAIGAFLAIKDFNNRNPWIVPILPKLIEGCDIQLTTAFYDSELNPLRGAEIVASVLKKETHTLATPYPSAIVGLAYSSEAKPSATLSGVYGVPIISNTASSTDLDNRDTYPTFARVIPVVR